MIDKSNADQFETCLDVLANSPVEWQEKAELLKDLISDKALNDLLEIASWFESDLDTDDTEAEPETE